MCMTCTSEYLTGFLLSSKKWVAGAAGARAQRVIRRNPKKLRTKSLRDHQERIAVHRLSVIGERLDGEAVLFHGRVNINGHGLRRGSRRSWHLALAPFPGTLGAEGAAVHEEHKGFFKSREKHVPFEFGQLHVDPPGPGMPVFRLFDLLWKMENGGHRILLEEPLAFRNRRGVRRASGIAAVFPAPEGALHPHPLRDDDVLRIDPFEVRNAVFLKQRLQFFPLFSFPTPFLLPCVALLSILSKSPQPLLKGGEGGFDLGGLLNPLSKFTIFF